MISDKGILYIEPTGPTLPEPLIDELTRKMTATYRKSMKGAAYRGRHTCACGAQSDNSEHRLPTGTETNSLCIHYLAFHREEIPESQLEKVRALSDGEQDPNDEELQAPTAVSVQLVRHCYRISSWRHDVSKHTYDTKSFEGETVEACDQKAKEWFKVASDKPGNGWEGMDLVRIDAPAVAEKVTYLDKNGRQEGDFD
jgi:hypothetical protein